MEIIGKSIEELGFKASKKGFFMEWKSLTDEFKIGDKISLNEASELAFNKLLSEIR
ncbi:hypothetical protein [Mariniflexile sp. AS56]|uniref:hypothetical protein n=1 Tax=Mariniflexile sp. AS56 TaxID=3063957 RepID=UPI0026E9B68D|nr:hypothetical protein [Mariniflexile sp. AS56]MDO7172438.1 hypothetical protein [Mariniflexile sp. AS56]